MCVCVSVCVCVCVRVSVVVYVCQFVFVPCRCLYMEGFLSVFDLQWIPDHRINICMCVFVWGLDIKDQEAGLWTYIHA